VSFEDGYKNSPVLRRCRWGCVNGIACCTVGEGSSDAIVLVSVLDNFGVKPSGDTCRPRCKGNDDSPEGNRVLGRS
jgi:hypothetical protein